MGNTLSRDHAIQAIINHFIAPESDCIGQLVTDDNFNNLSAQIAALSPMGRTAAWKAGISKWMETVAYAHKSFCDQTGCGYMCNRRLSDFTQTTQRDYANALKYAILQGAVFATRGNR